MFVVIVAVVVLNKNEKKYDFLPVIFPSKNYQTNELNCSCFTFFFCFFFFLL